MCLSFRSGAGKGERIEECINISTAWEGVGKEFQIWLRGHHWASKWKISINISVAGVQSDVPEFHLGYANQREKKRKVAPPDLLVTQSSQCGEERSLRQAEEKQRGSRGQRSTSLSLQWIRSRTKKLFFDFHLSSTGRKETLGEDDLMRFPLLEGEDIRWGQDLEFLRRPLIVLLGKRVSCFCLGSRKQ